MENFAVAPLNSSYQSSDEEKANPVEGYDDLTFGVFVATCMTEETPLIAVPPKERGASVWKATLNIINFIEGVGFLALPFAIAKVALQGSLRLLSCPLSIGSLRKY